MSRTVLIAALALVAGACSRGLIASHYGSTRGAGGGHRPAPHAGVDFRAPVGSRVLAAADGVVSAVFYHPLAGGTVVVDHPGFDRATVYLHLVATVRAGDEVRRGQEIGRVALFYYSYDTAHVHLELCEKRCFGGRADGDLDGTHDPLAIADGCFDPGRTYPTDRLVLTYPVACTRR